MVFNFTQLQKDALCEVFNISMSCAAASLSEMVREEVILSVPNIDLCSVSDVEKMFISFTSVSGIAQRFYGHFSGKAMLLLPENKSLELVQLMVGLDFPLDMLTSLEEDALVEIGNIVINACLGSLSDVLGGHFDCDVPTLVTGSYEKVLKYDSPSDDIIVMQIAFTLAAKPLEGHMLFMVNERSIDVLKKSINSFIIQSAGV